MLRRVHLSHNFQNHKQAETNSNLRVKVLLEPPSLENKALLQHDEKEVVCFIKGVDNNFAEQERIVNNITDGSFSFKQNNIEYAVVGRGIKYSLGLNSSSDSIYGILSLYFKNPHSEAQRYQQIITDATRCIRD